MGYLKEMKKQKPDRVLAKVRQYLKTNDLKAVPFDKGAGYCIMSSIDYLKRLHDILTGRQLERLKSPSRGKRILLKIEDNFNVASAEDF